MSYCLDLSCRKGRLTILWEFKDFHPDAELPGRVIPQHQKVHNALFIPSQEQGHEDVFEEDTYGTPIFLGLSPKKNKLTLRDD